MRRSSAKKEGSSSSSSTFGRRRSRRRIGCTSTHPAEDDCDRGVGHRGEEKEVFQRIRSRRRQKRKMETKLIMWKMAGIIVVVMTTTALSSTSASAAGTAAFLPLACPGNLIWRRSTMIPYARNPLHSIRKQEQPPNNKGGKKGTTWGGTTSPTTPLRSTSETTPTTTTTTTTTPPINPLLSNIQISKTVEVFSLVKQMEANGETVTSLCVGEPDFPPSPSILEATIAAIQSGQTRYTAVTGTIELREAIASDLKRRKGLTYNPVTDIVVGNGAKQCVYQGILATVGLDDAVLIPSPYWPSYPEMVRLVGGKPIIVETRKEDGYLLTPEQLRQSLEENPNVKCLILCNPSNPTGGVHDKQRLSELAEVLRDYPNVVVLADEIYERLVYTSNGEHTSFASLPDMFERTITVNGFSKAYAMTGMRLGYLAAPTPLAKACTTIQSQLTSCAGSISQAGGVAALTLVSDEELDNNVEIMRSKRDYVLQQLEDMVGVTIHVPPDGAFYVLPDVGGYYNGDDTALCIDLLKEQKLALVPGSAFGAPGTVRISYATSMEELDLAMRKLRTFLEDHRP